MKKIGNLDISFREYKDEIYYYDVKLELGNKKVSIVLPRYHTFLGWIEVFGLPPQNEWVVLDDLDDFKKVGTLKINDDEITECVQYVAGEKSHTIRTAREFDGKKEVCVWKQDYSKAPEEILSEILFKHDGGEYKTTWKTEVLETVAELSKEQKLFVSDIKKEHGEPDVLIRKTYKTSGDIPQMYYTLFPIQDLLDLTETSGSIIEIGYLRKDSKHKVDNVHGDWYKRFDFGNQQLYINETNYSSREITTGRRHERIKDTYRKELFTYSN